jgi:hypothetical protein
MKETLHRIHQHPFEGSDDIVFPIPEEAGVEGSGHPSSRVDVVAGPQAE